jgi:hypothetical protein
MIKKVIHLGVILVQYSGFKLVKLIFYRVSDGASFLKKVMEMESC